jgi:hypothetical protein
MGLFNGRNNIHAWEYALFGEECKRRSHPDEKLYAQLTEQQIANDCRIILESAEICRTTKDCGTLESRKKIAHERYEHLQKLIPFADSKQKSLIKKSQKAMTLIQRA